MRWLSALFNQMRDYMNGKRDEFILALIVFLGLCVYAQSFAADFILDDYPAILDNPFIKHLNFVQLWQYDPSRFLTNVTFSINYFIGGFHVFGWHLVNFVLHGLSSGLVYKITLRIFQAPRLSHHIPRQTQINLAFVTALIFLLHPIQTQAVIYIVQRAMLLSTFFYLTAFYFYIQARLTQNFKFYFYAVMAGYLAMLSKPLAMTLPLVVVVYELCFWGMDKAIDRKRRLVYFLLSLMIWITPVVLLGIPKLTVLAAQGYQAAPPVSQWMTRLSLIPEYLRLVFFPIGQNLDYDYPVITQSWQTALRLTAITIFLIGTVVRALWRREKIIAFGIVWFFVTLSLVIIFPLQDFIFEHWLYLSAYGFALCFTMTIYRLIPSEKFIFIIFCSLLGAYSFGTYQRVLIWSDPIRLMQDTVVKSPRKARVYNNLGWEFLKRGKREAAKIEFQKALTLDADYFIAKNNLAFLFYEENNLPGAQRLLESLVMEYPFYADAQINLGYVYQRLGKSSEAFVYFQKALQNNPHSSAAYIALGNIYQEHADLVNAKAVFQRAAWLKPENAMIYYNLGNLYLKEGNFYEALLHYDRAVRIQPHLAQAHINAGGIYFYLGDYKSALDYFQKAVHYNPNLPQGYFNLANTLYALGNVEQSKEAVKKAAVLYEQQGQTAIAERIQAKLKVFEPY